MALHANFFKLIFILLGLALAISGCKKSYSCTCRGYTTQEQLFTEQRAVEETSIKKAEASCALESYTYPTPYFPDEPNKVVIINCTLN